MVFVDFVPLGLLVGTLVGGSVKRLGDFHLRSLWLAFAAIGLQVVAFPSGVLPWSMPDAVARPLWLGSYVLLGALVLRNSRVPGVAFVGFGQVLNLVAIVANGGHMPATRSALDGAGVSYHLRNNSVSLVHPHVSWLVDRWAVPGWLPLGNVYSVGDVVIGLGVLATLVLAMRPPRGARGSATLRSAAALPPAEPSTESATLVRRREQLDRREEELEAAARRLTGRERGVLAAAADLRRRQSELERREEEYERRRLELREQEVARTAERKAAEPHVRVSRPVDVVHAVPDPPRATGAGEWNIATLERLTAENAHAFPDSAYDWEYTLLYLRDEARSDGALPPAFDSVIRQTFGELLDAAA